MFTLTPRLRRIVYVIAFEALAILFASLLLGAMSGGTAQESVPVAAAVSVVAVIWNWSYNLGFEAWERRRIASGAGARRGFWLRCGHALGFEAGLFLFTVPLYMLWYGVGFIAAFWMEAALLVFFLIYTFLFTLAFDCLFALPNRGREGSQPEVQTGSTATASGSNSAV